MNTKSRKSIGTNAAETYLLSVARGKRGLVPTLLRGTLGALAPVYCAGLKTYLLPYRAGLRKQMRLPCKVISIGNLTTGGTGKTPMTQALCLQLQQMGKQVAVLSRGYGGTFERGCAIVSDGQKVRLSPKEAGDEAHLLAKTLPGIPVIVGKDRRATGVLAIGQFHPDILILDDGMQFWQLHRDLEIVLVNARDPFDNGWTFPRGLLREPPSHLRRAGIVVLTNACQVSCSEIESLTSRVRRLAPGCPVFTADLVAAGLRTVLDRCIYPNSWLEGRRVGALSAIGNPASFETMIGDLGGILAARFRFRDHQTITLSDMDRVFAESCAADAEAIVTTEKDAVKMAPLKNILPVVALQVTMQVDESADFYAAVLESISGTLS